MTDTEQNRARRHRALSPIRILLAALGLLFLGVLLVFVGYRTGWIPGGHDEAEVRALDHRWQALEAEAAIPPVEGIPAWPTAETTRIYYWAQECSRSLGSESTVDPTFVEDLLDILRADPYAYPPKRTFDGSDFRRLIEAKLREPEPTLEEITLLAGLARRMGTLRGSEDFEAGIEALGLLLDLAEERPEVADVLRDVPAPRLEEAYFALCREALWLNETEPSSYTTEGPFAHEVGGRTLLHNALRAGLLDDLDVLRPQRSEPGSWTGVLDSRNPGGSLQIQGVRDWWTVFTREPEGLSDILLDHTWWSPIRTGRSWAETVRRWHEVVGP